MNGLPYYKRYPRDFIEGTIGMPFELKATYSFVLDLIYMQGGNLPDDPRYISGLLGVSVRKWNSLRQGLLDAGKIQVSGDFLTNYRAVSELESLRTLQEKQREKASRPRKNKDLTKATAQPQLCQPEPEPEKKEEPNGSSKKGSRLSPDWRLPKDWGDWALKEGLDATSIRREADKFKDWWHSVSGQKGVKLDWAATWRNWVRKAIDDKRGNLPASKSNISDAGAFGKLKEVTG